MFNEERLVFAGPESTSSMPEAYDAPPSAEDDLFNNPDLDDNGEGDLPDLSASVSGSSEAGLPNAEANRLEGSVTRSNEIQADIDTTVQSLIDGTSALNDTILRVRLQSAVDEIAALAGDAENTVSNMRVLDSSATDFEDSLSRATNAASSISQNNAEVNRGLGTNDSNVGPLARLERSDSYNAVLEQQGPLETDLQPLEGLNNEASALTAELTSILNSGEQDPNRINEINTRLRIIHTEAETAVRNAEKTRMLAGTSNTAPTRQSANLLAEMDNAISAGSERIANIGVEQETADDINTALGIQLEADQAVVTGSAAVSEFNRAIGQNATITSGSAGASQMTASLQAMSSSRGSLDEAKASLVRSLNTATQAANSNPSEYADSQILRIQNEINRTDTLMSVLDGHIASAPPLIEQQQEQERVNGILSRATGFANTAESNAQEIGEHLVVAQESGRSATRRHNTNRRNNDLGSMNTARFQAEENRSTARDAADSARALATQEPNNAQIATQAGRAEAAAEAAASSLAEVNESVERTYDIIDAMSEQ